MMMGNRMCVLIREKAKVYRCWDVREESLRVVVRAVSVTTCKKIQYL
jgi:hypothetical protein